MGADDRRVLVVSPSLSGGGAERFASTLVEHLARIGFRPALCLLRGPISYRLTDGVEVEILGKTRPYHILRAILGMREVLGAGEPTLRLVSFP